MTCAIVLDVNGPFENVEDELALIKTAEIRAVSAAPLEDIIVLIARGFDKIPRSIVARLADLRYRIVDASAEFAAVRQRYSFAANNRIWTGDELREFGFVRWLVLEAYFGATPILAMDAAIAWRVDPFVLYERWKDGGSFLCFGSPSLAFIRDSGWYEVYRSGLERLAVDPNFGKDFAQDNLRGIQDDHSLFQYLIQQGELQSDHSNFLGHEFDSEYFFHDDPLKIEPRPGAPPLKFEQSGAEERIDGKTVPFWHMKASFLRYLFLARFLPAFAGRENIRVPFEPPDHVVRDPVLMAFNNILPLLKNGAVTFHHKRHQGIVALARREQLYAEFFEGDLARYVFQDETWWCPGVWGLPAEPRPSRQSPVRKILRRMAAPSVIV
jgi:hypothetical protein